MESHNIMKCHHMMQCHHFIKITKMDLLYKKSQMMTFHHMKTFHHHMMTLYHMMEFNHFYTTVYDGLPSYNVSVFTSPLGMGGTIRTLYTRSCPPQARAIKLRIGLLLLGNITILPWSNVEFHLGHSLMQMETNIALGQYCNISLAHLASPAT